MKPDTHAEVVAGLTLHQARQALGRIHRILDGEPNEPGKMWSSDEVEWVAAEITDLGFTIRNPSEPYASSGPTLPLPGEEFLHGTVVASVWIRDDVPEPFALVLVLGGAPPYYTVAEITWRNGWVTEDMRQHPNIVPAVEDYQQNGGDY